MYLKEALKESICVARPRLNHFVTKAYIETYFSKSDPLTEEEVLEVHEFYEDLEIEDLLADDWEPCYPEHY